MHVVSIQTRPPQAPSTRCSCTTRRSRLITRRLAHRVVWAEWGPLPFQLRTGVPRRAYVASAARVAQVACVSEGTRQTIVAAGVDHARTSVVPNLVQVADHHFGCVTRFQHKKRNDVLVDALDHLPADAKVLAVLAGAGPDEDALRARAAGHGASRAVILGLLGRRGPRPAPAGRGADRRSCRCRADEVDASGSTR